MPKSHFAREPATLNPGGSTRVGGARPRPTPSELTRPFWEHASNKVLVRQRCLKCGNSFFTPQMACPHCLSTEWEWAESTGVGRVYSYTVCHRAPQPGFAVPYVLVIVDLDDGWSMLSNVVGCDPAIVRIGMRVQVTWLDLGDSLQLPVFEPMQL